MSMKIYLVGYMGCGKTTIGRQLAERLNMSFIDLDHYIENKHFKTVTNIFAEEGEAGFRKKEQAALHEVAAFEDVIVATGGGAPCFFNNMELMNQTGHCIFLDVDTKELSKRLSLTKTERPVIKGKTKDELVDFIDGMMQKRRPYYEKAKYILKGNNITLDQLLEIIHQ